MLKKFRVALALLMWAGVTILLLDVSGAVHAWLGWMAKIQFLPALLALNVSAVVLVLVLTMLVGRIYCSVICPLGIMQDGISHVTTWFLPKRARKFGRFMHYEGKWHMLLRYALFFIFVLLLLMGMGFITRLVSPYSMYGRIVVAIFKPLYIGGNNLLADWAAANDSYAFWHVGDLNPSLSFVAVAVISLLVVGSMAVVGGRDYCNHICPVGTALGLFSRRALFRVQIDNDKCRHCGLCELKCKARAIDAKAGTVDASLCVDCFNCLDACNRDALHFTLAKRRKSGESKASTDTSRRNLIVTAAAMTAAAALKAEEKTVDGGYITLADKKPFERETPVCPPGALSLKSMQQHCTGCQLCVSACENHVLRPSTSLSNFMQPVMSFENGHCRPECHACSDVCPAGAILPLGKTHDEKMARKSSLKIGRAVFIKENCIQIADDVNCGSCARRCPAGAITLVPEDPNDRRSRKMPVVDEERCIGCGACEHLCPARPFAAIHVEGIEVQREI